MFNIFYILLSFLCLSIYIFILTLSYIPLNLIGLSYKVSDKKIIKLRKNPIEYLTKLLLKLYPKLKLNYFRYNLYKLSYIETIEYNQENPSLIFIHGTFSSSIIWLDTCDKILKLNPKLNIFAIDLMGAGLSSDIDLSYLEFINLNKIMLNKFILSKNLIDPIIISSSFGGLINLEYCLEYSNYSKLIVFNPPAIFPLINKYQYYITLIFSNCIIEKSLGLFSPEIIYKLGKKFKLDIETIYWLCTLRTNTLSKNIIKGTKINFTEGYCTRSIIKNMLSHNNIKTKCKFIFSLQDDIVGAYGGKLIEEYGFDVQYIDHSHFLSSYDNIAELILNSISSSVKYLEKNNISYNLDNKYYFYPSPNLSQNQIDLLINDIKYFS